jgi:hypothetical protein
MIKDEKDTSLFTIGNGSPLVQICKSHYQKEVPALTEMQFPYNVA